MGYKIQLKVGIKKNRVKGWYKKYKSWGYKNTIKGWDKKSNVYLYWANINPISLPS